MILDIDEGRYNKRALKGRKRLFRSFLITIILCVVSYKMGYESVRSREEAYKKQVENVQQGRGELENQITSLISNLQSSDVRYKQLLEKYEANMPKGNHKYLAALVKQQLDLGMNTERLAQLIRSTRPPQNCSKPVIKRFVMVNPNYQGPDSDVSFANGAVTISGKGESAVNSYGKLEAWYDPSKSVEVTFKTTGGKIEKKQGLLPIYHSIISGNTEYRFTLAAGEQSFLNVTVDSCDYP